jgi:hypothetical protein
VVEDEGDVKEHLERGTEVDFGLVFEDGDDEEWRASAFEVYLFDGVRIAVFLEEGQMTFGDVFDVIGVDIFEYVERDEAVQELNKEFVVVEYDLETVVFGFFYRHEYPP